MKNIPITTPSITSHEIAFVARAMKDGWGKGRGTYIKKFEKMFSKYVGTRYAFATSSATSALHIAIKALGIGPGDEVIVPETTWISSAAVVLYEGATPVFVDITPDTWTLDPGSVEKAITKRTKAIMPITLYGSAPDMTRIMRLARRYHLKVIEDAAQSVGVMHCGKRPGSFGDCGAFSFHGTKVITTGEGGMFVTNDRKLFEKAVWISNQCVSPDKLFWAEDIGLKSKMTDMQAALGYAQLKRVNELVGKKRKIFQWYKKCLKSVRGITLNTERRGDRNTYWMTTIVLDKRHGFTKEKFMERLKEFGIASRPFFYPLSSMPPFKNPKYSVRNPVAYDLSTRGVNLPCGQNLTEKDVSYVCESVKRILGV